MPNQGAVMLWDTCRGKAIDLSISLAESFQRMTAPKARPAHAAMPDIGGKIELSFENGIHTLTSPAKPAGQKPEKIGA